MAERKFDRGFGWKPEPDDPRDYKLKVPLKELPPEVDLRQTGFLPDIWDQGQLGSCTAFASCAAYSFDLDKQASGDNYDPSELFVYYNTRFIEGTVDEDSGAYIRDAIKSLNKYGVPAESEWPYDISKYAERPSDPAYESGLLREALKYATVDVTTRDLKAVLASGYPVVVGFTVYESFDSDQVINTGIVPLPNDTERILGGHAVLVVGYKLIDGNLYWICRNSWGTSWGDNGYFYMPEAYLTNTDLADDFWVVYQVTSPDPGPIVVPDDDNNVIESVIECLEKLIEWLKGLIK
jgi:C1A family cysteine protease